MASQATADERIIKTSGPSDRPSFKILKADGKQISTNYRVESMVVTESLGRISEATIILQDGDVSQEDFEVSNSDDFIPGNELTIQAGYAGKDSTIFKGIIIKHGISIRQNRSFLTIVLKHKAVQATYIRQSKTFNDQKDSEILETILGKYEIPKDVEATNVKHKQMLQYQCSDWDFINLRAEACGKFVFSANEKIKILKPDLAADPKLTIVWGASLQEFEGEIDGRNSFENIKTKSWSYADQKMLEGEPSLNGINEMGNLKADDIAEKVKNIKNEQFSSGNLSDKELENWANGYLLRSKLAKIRGRARCIGFSDVHPGDMVKLAGVGKRFNGKGFVSGIRHEIALGDWHTDIQFGLDEKWYYQWFNDISEPPANGLLSAVKGLQIGIAVSLEDPLKEGRVLVKIPVMSETEEAIWARVGSLDAGEERGFYFRPEPADEVILGFLNGDPRQAVILGMLHSSKKKTPFEAKKENNEKGLITRSKMKLTFDDDKKSVTIETPKGNKFIISEDKKGFSMTDQNGNKFEMNDSGISIESKKDIQIKATGDCKIEGINGEFKGSATLKLNGGGQAELKGGMVMIN